MIKINRKSLPKCLIKVSLIFLVGTFFGNCQEIQAESLVTIKQNLINNDIEDSLNRGVPIMDPAVSYEWGEGWEDKYGLEEDKWIKETVQSSRKLIEIWEYTYLDKQYFGKIYHTGKNIRTGKYDLQSLSYTIQKNDGSPVQRSKDYTFLFSQGSNSTISARTFTGNEDTLLSSTFYTGEGNPVLNEGVAVYTQYTKDGIRAVQTRARGNFNGSIDAPMRVTYIPMVTGGVKSYMEMKNTSKNDLNAGYAITFDTHLNNNDNIPLYNYRPGQGIYMNNDEDEYKILMKKTLPNEGPFDNYFAHNYTKGWAPFPDGRFKSTGHEIDRNRDELLLEKVDSAVSYKWNLTSMPSNSIRKMGLDFELKSITPPTFTLNEKDTEHELYDDEQLQVSGLWRDKDSSKVQLYMRAYPKGASQENIEKVSWKQVNKDNDYFENDSFDTDKAWDMGIDVSEIGEPSVTPYQVEFKMRDYPGDDFSKETHALTVKVMKDVTVETRYLDKKTGKPIEINGLPVLSHKATYQLGSAYQTRPENFEPNYYFTGKKSSASDLESGTISTVTNKKVEYLYERGKVTLNVLHLINNDPKKVLKKEKIYLGYLEPYDIKPLTNSETMEKDVVWDETTPRNSSGTTGVMPSEITITFNYIEGSIKVIGAPKTVNFGNSLRIRAFPNKYFLENKDLSLKIKDQRKDKSDRWRLGAKVKQELTSNQDGTKIPSAFHFVSKGEREKDIPLEEDQLLEIYQQKKATINQGTVETKITWDGTEEEGLCISTEPGQVKAGLYSGKIQWFIINAL